MTLIATTTAGQIEGTDRKGVLRFAGIPYAAPPVGDLRFRPPQPHEGWSGVRAAASFGPQSWQSGAALGGLLGGATPTCDEDCLTLNIQTPALDGERRPVLFWIHGGGFIGGSGATPWYDGRSFVQRGDVVVVSINYRLGALGFLHLAELGGADFASSGLNGILDQVAALEWVRDNIEHFGGDPDNVTIFGESAGGMSVGTLLGLPRARGLFHKAIPQSGAASNLAAPSAAAHITELLCESLGTDDLSALLSMDPATLLAAQDELPKKVVAEARASSADGHAAVGAGATASTMGLPFQPVIDGFELPRGPLDAVRDGLNADVPVLVGTTADEWKLFAMTRPSKVDRPRVLRRLERLTPNADAVLEAYESNRPDAPIADVWSAILTDMIFRVPAIQLAEAQSAHQPNNTFMYRFSWASKAFDGALGSCHALEIPFVFDNLGRGGAELFLGVSPNEPEVAELAELMNDAWSRFGTSGDPNGGKLPHWPAYDVATRSTMDFGSSTRVLDDPEADERALWP